MVTATRPFSLPASAEAKLEALVDRVEARPGDMIDVREFRELQERLNVRAVLATLPEGLTEEDLPSSRSYTERYQVGRALASVPVSGASGIRRDHRESGAAARSVRGPVRVHELDGAPE